MSQDEGDPKCPDKYSPCLETFGNQYDFTTSNEALLPIGVVGIIIPSRATREVDKSTAKVGYMFCSNHFLNT